MKKHLALGALAAFGALAYAESASAHANLSPPVALAKEGQVFTLAVPTEKEGATTTSIELTLPSGFAIDSFVPTTGWKRTTQQTGSGEEAVITKVTWAGGSVPTGDDPADLEHRLVAVAQRQAARVTAPPHPVQVDAHGAAEAEHATGRERLSPDGEEVAERRPALEADDARGIERPEPRSAMRAHSDPGRHDRDTAVREKLGVEARAGPKRRLPAGRHGRGSRGVTPPHPGPGP